MLILLAGIHGVGKTSLAHCAEKSLGIRHLVASELIKRNPQRSQWTPGKNVEDIDKNQSLLINELNIERNRWNSILLDGHVALKDKSGTIKNLPNDLFKQIGINAIVLIEAEPDLVIARIMKRDSQYLSIPEVEALASAERTGCRQISNKMQIPMVSLREPQPSAFCDTIATLQRQYTQQV